MSAFVQFEKVRKVYQMGEVQIEALRDATFEIEKGEICVIVGASGAGKTTLLNIIGGMDELTSGRVMLDGQEISKYSSKQLTTYRRYDIGFVFQFYNLIQNLTALENVELAAQICRNPMDAEKVIELVGLKDRANNFPTQLSGGEQQRVAIARALANDPGLLIVDEPTGNLDPKRSYELVGLLKEINRCGTTVIMITHEHELVRYFGGRIINLDKGSITFDEMMGGSDYYEE